MQQVTSIKDRVLVQWKTNCFVKADIIDSLDELDCNKQAEVNEIAPFPNEPLFKPRLRSGYHGRRN